MSDPKLPKQVFQIEDVLASCQVEASTTPLLGLPPDVDSYHLMIAIAIVESSLGANCGPRYEPAYDIGGGFWKISHLQRELVQKFEGAAACSYGPWQMMYCNFPFQVNSSTNRLRRSALEPTDLLNYNDKMAALSYADDFSTFWNHYVPHFKPTSLKELAEIWNAGHITPDPVYEKKIQTAYNQALSLYPQP